MFPRLSRFFLQFSFVFILIGMHSCRTESERFTSPHFKLIALSDGVWAAIHKPGGEAICNAGIVDLGDATLVFDCFLTPKAATDLKATAEHLTGRAVTYVVNSHYHNDHIRGNQVFDEDTRIISTERIRKLISVHEPEEITSEKEFGPEWLAEMEKEFDTVTEPQRKEALIMWMAYVQGMLDSHDELITVLPDTVFSQQMEITGSSRSVVLKEYDNGHTENDIVLLLEEEGILFTGDLLFTGCHPYLADGDPLHLLEILEELKKFNCRVFVPGHGAPGSGSDIDRLAEYIHQIEGLSKQYHAQNKTAEDIVEEDIPEDYQDWLFPNFFKYNLGYMLEHTGEPSQ